MKRKLTKIQWIPIPIYNTRLGVFFGGTPQDAYKALGAPDCQEGLGGATFIGPDIVMWLKDPKNPSLLVHELVHVVTAILPPLGLPLNTHTDEAYAYLAQYLFNEVRKL